MEPSGFVKEVVSAYDDGRGVFANKINAEDLVPEGLPDKDKALYLFYVIQLDYAMKSQILYAGAKALYIEHDDFFNPTFILSQSDPDLRKLLQDYLHPRYINEAIKRYTLNSKKLLAEYNANPLLLWSESITAMGFLKKVRQFRGFGPKIGNFFVRTMINTFELDFPDVEEILPPVDVHDVRIAYLLGFTNTADMTQKNISKVKNVWSDACRDSKVSWLIFDKALWLIGSEGSPKSKEDVLVLIK